MTDGIQRAAMCDGDFVVVKVNCAALPVRTEAAVWLMRRETGGATAGPTFRVSAARSTTARTTASTEAHAWARPWVGPLPIR